MKRDSFGTHLHLIGVHQAMSMASSGTLSGGHALAAPVAAPAFHEELTRVIESHSGVRLPAKNRSELARIFQDLLSWPKTRLTRENLKREVAEARALVHRNLPGLKASAKASALQMGANYALILALNAILHKHGINPEHLQLTPFNATLAHQGATLAVFLAEYAAVRKQLRSGIVPASAQGAVPVAAVLAGEKGAARWTVLSYAIDAAKNALPGGGGGNPVWKNLPGLGVRFALAVLNYVKPEWSHSVVGKIRLPGVKKPKPGR